MGVNNLRVDAEEASSRRLRVGLAHGRTGVPLFLIYLTGIDKVRSFAFHSVHEVEVQHYRATGDLDRAAWRNVLAFFQADGRSAHVVASPISEGTPLLGQMIGREKSLTDRSGVYAIRDYVHSADLVLVPQAGQLLGESAQHGRFYRKLFELCTMLGRYFVLVDFPKTYDRKRIAKWAAKVNFADAAMYYPWLLQGAKAVPPSPIVAAAIQRNDREHGIHDAPSNRPLTTVFRPLVRISPPEIQECIEERINVVTEPREGEVRLWGAATLADRLDFESRFISTRRTLLALREAVQEICEPFVLEPMNRDLEHTIEVSLHSFFQSNRRIFDAGSKRPFETTVRVDPTAHENLIEVDIRMALPYVVDRVSLSTALTG